MEIFVTTIKWFDLRMTIGPFELRITIGPFNTKWSPLMISTYVHVMLVDVKMIFYYDVVILHLRDKMCFVRLILWNKLFFPEMKINFFIKHNLKRIICFLIKNSLFDQSYPNLNYTVTFTKEELSRFKRCFTFFEMVFQ